MKNKYNLSITPNIKIQNYFNKEKNSVQKEKPIKVVNLYVDNMKKQKLLNEDDLKLFFFTHRLINQFKIDIKDIRRIKSSFKLNKNNNNLYNYYKFFKKNKSLTISQNLTSKDSTSSKIDFKKGIFNDLNNIDKNNIIPKNKNTKKQLIKTFNNLSEKDINDLNLNIKYKILENKRNKFINILPNFKSYTNILPNKKNNQNSTSFPQFFNKNNLGQKDFLNITKINYLNTLPEKKNNNINLNNQKSNIINKTLENKEYNSINKEKNIRIITMREKLKLFSFINNKKHQILYDKPPTNFYENDKFYYYNVYPENCGWLIKDCLKHRTKWKECHSLSTNLFNFKWKEVALINDFLDYNDNKDKKQMINHFENNSCITNKYNLFLNFTKYCENKNIDVFKYIPFTIILDDSDYEEFSEYLSNFKQLFANINNHIFDNKSIQNQIFDRRKVNYKTYFPMKDPKIGIKTYIEIPSTHFAGKNLWIVKAPNLNRGRCIKVFNDYNKIIKFINEITRGNAHEYDNIKDEKEKKNNNENINGYKYKSNKIIIQKYIEKPFLYYGRKFDIRIWVLLTHKMAVYIFKEGHLKASSNNYDLDSNNSFIHITNYSLQKYNKYFSKYERGNEVSFEIFQKYIENNLNKNINFKDIVFPQFKEIIKHTIKCASNLINFNNRKNCFELMGYDFLLDEEFNVFLIEINSNPGLEISSEIIKILVPRMIDDALRLTVDDIFKTDYDEEWKNQKGEYCSKFHVKGYKDKDNMWEYICDANENKTNEINIYNNKSLKKKSFQRLKIKKHNSKRKKSKSYK